MKRPVILTFFFFTYIQATTSFALPENHSFEESLGTISKHEDDDQSTNIDDINIEQSIETILLMSPFQWAISENTTGLKKNNTAHQKKSLTAERDVVNYRADALNFASPQLIAEEIAASQIHLENAAYIQNPAITARVEAILESNKPTGTAQL